MDKIKRYELVGNLNASIHASFDSSDFLHPSFSSPTTIILEKGTKPGWTMEGKKSQTGVKFQTPINLDRWTCTF